jgi:hypothetical protein
LSSFIRYSICKGHVTGKYYQYSGNARVFWEGGGREVEVEVKVQKKEGRVARLEGGAGRQRDKVTGD